MLGADLLIRELLDRGVSNLYTLCGNGLDPILMAAQKAGLRVIDVRNEQAAGYMADAVGRLTRRVGVAAASAGVAHVNALTGVCNAWFDGAPMLLITGATDSATVGRGHFQDMDTVGISRPLCKFAQWLDRPERIPLAVQEAFSAALSGRPGPVHLTIPMDVMRAEMADLGTARRKPKPTIYDSRAAADPAAVKEAARIIRRSTRPMIIAGSGAFYADAFQPLARLARILKAPVAVPIWDRGVIEEPIPEFVGVIGAASGEPKILPEADLVLLAGAKVDYRIGYLEPPAVPPGAKVIRLEIDPREMAQSIQPDVPLLCDPQSGLTQLAGALKGHRGNRIWIQEARRRAYEFHRAWREAPVPASPPVTGRHVIEAVKKVITRDTFLLVDGGNIGQWFHMAMCDRYPARWMTCGASGVVGWGIPAAIAVRSLYPQNPVLLLSGDGSATFTIAELEAASRQKLPFVCVVADDCAWGVVISMSRRRGSIPVGAKLGPIQFAKVAQGFGARGVLITDPKQLPAAIKEGFSAEYPTLIHVPIAGGGPTD
ncbi:MAG: thiamine pyrophosphate-binding protein [Syntrophaceae bacterium]|nr:thiamine pyrophosphate-binding protein [Syntrophaceae bacterium]